MTCRVRKSVGVLPGILLTTALLLFIVVGVIGAAGNGNDFGAKFFRRDQNRETKVNMDDAELTIPPGTGSEEMTVSSENTDLDGIEIPFGLKVIRTYKFGPSGLKFQESKKLRLRLKWDPVEYPGGLPDSMRLYYVNRESKKLELGGGAINEQTGDFEGEIPHFSEYVIGISAGWGDDLNIYRDYVHAGEERVGIANLGLTVNSTVYSVPLRGGSQLKFTRVYRSDQGNGVFSLSRNWYLDLLSYYTLGSRFGPAKPIYSSGNVTRYEAAGTVYEIHRTTAPPPKNPDDAPVAGIEAIYLSDGTRIEPRARYETVFDPNGNWIRYEYGVKSGFDGYGNPRNFLKIISLKDCLGREFYFSYINEDQYHPFPNAESDSKCVKPFLEKVEQKMVDGSYKTILSRRFKVVHRREYIERFTDCLNQTTTYTNRVDHNLNNPDYPHKPITAHSIIKVVYPNGTRTEYEHFFSPSYGITWVTSQKFYRPGATSPFRAVGYQKGPCPGWYEDGEWQPTVAVNDGTTLKRYYLNKNGNTDHEETLDGQTQKLLKNVRYTYANIKVLKSGGVTSTEETVRPLSVFTKFAKADGSWSTEMMNGYAYDNWANIIYSKDPYGTETRTLYNNTGSMSINLAAYEMRNPLFISKGKFRNKPATQAVIVTDPVHQTKKLQQTHYEYDSKGNLLTERVVLQTETGANQYLDTKYTYDDYGSPKTKTDPNNNAIQFEYGSQYQYAYLTAVTTGGKTLARYEYDFDTGVKTSATDPKGNVYHYEYDPLGRLKKEYLEDSDPDVAITKTMVYNDQKNQVTLNFGNSTRGFQEGRMTYDWLFGKPTLIERKLNGVFVPVKKMSYDSDGQLAWEEDNLGHRTSHSYDHFGRELKTIIPGGQTITNTYSQVSTTSRTVTTTDANGNTRKQYFDRLDRVFKVEEHPDESATVTTSYKYDTAGHLIQTSNDRGIISTNTFDNLGRLVRVDYPQDPSNPMAPEVYEYDMAGNLWKKTTAQGTKFLEYEFNGGYRLKKVTEADGRVIDYTYDDNDNILTQSNGGVTYTYSGHDARNRATQFTATLDGQSFSFSYDYDTYGRITGITYPNRAQAVTYNYDEMDRLLAIPGFVTSCGYDGDNKLTDMLFGNGVNTHYTYSTLNDRLTNIVVGPSGSLLEMDYGYDSVGNITQINNDYYGYDGLNRLTWAGDLTTPGTGNGMSWKYDASGNMTAKERFLGGVSQGVTNFSYDLANRLWTMGSNTYTNDSSGNRTGKTGVDNWSYSYDGENRLTQVTKNGVDVFDNVYDGAGMRIKEVKGGETTYFVYQGNNPLLEYTPGDGKYKYFIYAGNKMIAEEVDGVVKYYHGDHLGSTRMVTDAAGSKVAEYKFAPFGEKEAYSGSFGTKYQFTGKPGIDEVGLSYFGARFYDPETGRFLTLDPGRQGLNWYAYCGNNPLGNVDPDGRAYTEAIALTTWELNFIPVYGNIAYACLVISAAGIEYGPTVMQALQGLYTSADAASKGAQGSKGSSSNNNQDPKKGPEIKWKTAREIEKEYGLKKGSFHDFKGDILKDLTAKDSPYKDLMKKVGNNPDIGVDSNGNVCLKATNGSGTIIQTNIPIESYIP